MRLPLKAIQVHYERHVPHTNLLFCFNFFEVTTTTLPSPFHIKGARGIQIS